jgi:hypothetical protein
MRRLRHRFIVRFGSPEKAQCAASGKIPRAYRGYSVVRFGSPEKAQCAASGPR